MATKMKMVSKAGKMVPAFAADGKGKMQMGGAKMKKYSKGGEGDDPKKPMTNKEYRASIKEAKRDAKLSSIKSDGEYLKNRSDRRKTFAEAIGSVVGGVATGVEVAKGVKELKAMKKGGMVKKYQDGGKTGAQLKKEGMAMKAKGTAMKVAGSAQKAKGAAMAKANTDKMVKKLSTAGSGISAYNYGNSDRVYKKGGTTSSKKK